MSPRAVTKGAKRMGQRARAAGGAGGGAAVPYPGRSATVALFAAPWRCTHSVERGLSPLLVLDDQNPYALPIDPDVSVEPARVAHHFDPADYGVGLTRAFIELVGDGLATGVRLPILVARGAHPGPVFGLTAGVHGNELNGIPVIHELIRELDISSLHGTVVGVVAVNVPGLHANQRRFIDGADLNRIFPGSPSGSVSEVFAHRVIHRIVHRFDILIDLHTASFGRVNSLYVRADMGDPTTAAMARLQHPQIIVHNPAGDRTLRGAAMTLGVPAITVEIGDPQRWQRNLTRDALAGVRRVLSWAKLTEPVEDSSIVDTVVCSSSSWVYTDRGGLLTVFPRLMDRVRKDDRIALVHNAFGDAIREYRAPHDGIVVGKSTNPVGYTGARVLHLGRIAGPGEFQHEA